MMLYHQVTNMSSLVANLNIKTSEFHDTVDRYLEWMRDKETPVRASERAPRRIHICVLMGHTSSRKPSARTHAPSHARTHPAPSPAPAPA